MRRKKLEKKKTYFGTDRVKKDVATLGLVQRVREKMGRGIQMTVDYPYHPPKPLKTAFLFVQIATT
jgi:hypothetical protein